MPAQFDACVKNGGRVRTKSLSGGRFIHLCFIDGKSYAGEVKAPKAQSVRDDLKDAVKAHGRAA